MDVLSVLFEEIQQGFSEIIGIQHCGAFPRRRDDIRLPAILIDLVELEPGSDPGTGELALIAHFEARILVSDQLPESDLWALGIMLYHLAGLTFTYVFEDEKFEAKLVAAWSSQLGSASASELCMLDKFPFTKTFHDTCLTSNLPRAALHRSVQHTLGFQGVKLARQFLSWCPMARGSTSSALVANLFSPDRWTLVPAPCAKGYAHPATSSFTGVRHLWNCAEGQIAPEILRHMIADMDQ